MSFFLGFKISYILSKILTGYVTLFSCLADLLVAIISARKKKVIFCIVMSALLIGTFILYNSNLYNRVDSACNSDKYYFGEEKKAKQMVMVDYLIMMEICYIKENFAKENIRVRAKNIHIMLKKMKRRI